MESILLLLASIIFFFLGRYSISSKDIETAKEQLKKLKKVDVGVVKRPSQEDLDARTPQGKKIKETEEAMEETLGHFL